MLPQKIAFVDIETTGCSLSRNRIIEIGVLRVEDNKLVDTYQTLINPDCFLPPEIEKITGITERDVENAPRFSSVKKDLMAILKDCTFAAHNVRFDYGFLKNELRREEVTFRARHFCTCRLSQKLYPQYRHHNLTAIIDRFNFLCEKRHRAFDDARILWEFYQRIQDEFPKEILEKTFATLLKRPSTPPKINEQSLDDLPDSPGVYIFYGEQKVPLYIGKSINIKERVLSHFVNDGSSPVEMKIAQQVTDIETIPTVGEMGALLKEAELIKTMQPMYNKRLRISRKLVVIKSETDKNGYKIAKVETVTDPASLSPETVIGITRSKKSATELLQNIAKENGLCLKLLGLEKTKSQCFAHSLGRCKGACVGKEPPLMYNLRFDTAFVKTKIRPWPFEGPIMIEESDDTGTQKEAYIIDKWCCVGTMSYTSRKKSIRWQSNHTFDLDFYNIIRNVLRYKKAIVVKEMSRSDSDNFEDKITAEMTYSP